MDVAGIEPALPGLGDIPPASGQTISRPLRSYLRISAIGLPPCMQLITLQSVILYPLHNRALLFQAVVVLHVFVTSEDSNLIPVGSLSAMHHCLLTGARLT